MKLIPYSKSRPLRFLEGTCEAELRLLFALLSPFVTRKRPSPRAADPRDTIFAIDQLRRRRREARKFVVGRGIQPAAALDLSRLHDRRHRPFRPRHAPV